MHNFSVAARAIMHLGAELITSDEIAIYELIKNSFDAGSERVSIKFMCALPKKRIDDIADKLINTSGKFSTRRDVAARYMESLYESECLSGAEDHFKNIVVKLDGAEDEEDALLVLDNINYIEISDTGCGMTKNDLENVFLRIGTDSKLNKINVGNSRRRLLGNKGIGRLAMMRLGRKSEVTSWKENANNAYSINFHWDDFNDPNLSISDIYFDIERVSKPKTSKSGTKIRITSLEEEWSESILNDGLINNFLRRLRNPFDEGGTKFPINVYFNSDTRINIKKLSDELWALADYHLVFNMQPEKLKKENDEATSLEISNVKKGGASNTDRRSAIDIFTKTGLTIDNLKEIGPVRLVIRWYNRKNLARMGLGKELRPMQRELNLWSGGIAIYRDGFRVGMTGSDKDGDWFGLDAKAFRGSGFFVNSIQTVGAIEITASNNPKLIDRSNREGLIQNKATKNLIKLLSALAVEELRVFIQSEGEFEKKKHLADLSEEGTERIEEKLEIAKKSFSAIRNEVPSSLKKDVANLEESLHYLSANTKRYDEALKMAKENRENILELAGVGTVMNSALHELTRSTMQTKELLQKLAKRSDHGTKDLLLKLESEIRAINTRLRQLDPVSTTGRQRKVRFDANKLLRVITDGYAVRFKRHEIQLVITVDDEESDEAVTVRMVKGFFCLAIENLISNSVYWLQKGMIPGENKRKIHIDIDKKASAISVYDNGRGISPADKKKVFEAGFSLKDGGKGYGLYIAKEVAYHHNSNLYLADMTEKDDRLHTFIFEMPKE